MRPKNLYTQRNGSPATIIGQPRKAHYYKVLPSLILSIDQSVALAICISGQTDKHVIKIFLRRAVDIHTDLLRLHLHRTVG